MQISTVFKIPYNKIAIIDKIYKLLNVVTRKDKYKFVHIEAKGKEKDIAMIEKRIKLEKHP